MKYTAITIGPIIKTINLAKSTRELWGASFLFSHICKLTIEQIQTKYSDANIIIPHTPSKDLKIGAGLYPDRIILKSDSEIDIITIKEMVINILLSEEGFNIKDDDKQKFSSYLNQYIRIEAYSLESDKLPVISIQKYLDQLELQASVVEDDNSNHIIRHLSNNSNLKFIQDAFENKAQFASIPEISSIQLHGGKQRYKVKTDMKDNTNIDLNDNYIQQIKRDFKDTFKTYHKYIAFVQADGDSVGSLIESYEDDVDEKGLIKCSENLFSFAQEAVEGIKEYGAVPVYAGGDDLFFIAPVFGKNNTSIFNLVDKLSAIFEEKLPLSGEIKPTLSFGISISYHKYPMQESIIQAQKQLFAVAKNHSEGDCKKNAIAVTIQKHSGQSFNIVQHKESEYYKTFIELVSLYENTTDDKQFLRSVITKIDNNRLRMLALLKNTQNIESFGEHLSCMFNTEFNKDIHTSFDSLFALIKKLIKIEAQTIVATNFNKEKDEDYFNEVYNTLRFVKFLIRKDSDE